MPGRILAVFFWFLVSTFAHPASLSASELTAESYYPRKIETIQMVGLTLSEGSFSWDNEMEMRRLRSFLENAGVDFSTNGREFLPNSDTGFIARLDEAGHSRLQKILAYYREPEDLRHEFRMICITIDKNGKEETQQIGEPIALIGPLGKPIAHADLNGSIQVEYVSILEDDHTTSTHLKTTWPLHDDLVLTSNQEFSLMEGVERTIAHYETVLGSQHKRYELKALAYRLTATGTPYYKRPTASEALGLPAEYTLETDFIALPRHAFIKLTGIESLLTERVYNEWDPDPWDEHYLQDEEALLISSLAAHGLEVHEEMGERLTFDGVQMIIHANRKLIQELRDLASDLSCERQTYAKAHLIEGNQAKQNLGLLGLYGKEARLLIERKTMDKNKNTLLASFHYTPEYLEDERIISKVHVQKRLHPESLATISTEIGQWHDEEKLLYKHNSPKTQQSLQLHYHVMNLGGDPYFCDSSILDPDVYVTHFYPLSRSQLQTIQSEIGSLHSFSGNHSTDRHIDEAKDIRKYLENGGVNFRKTPGSALLYDGVQIIVVHTPKGHALIRDMMRKLQQHKNIELTLEGRLQDQTIATVQLCGIPGKHLESSLLDENEKGFRMAVESAFDTDSSCLSRLDIHHHGNMISGLPAFAQHLKETLTEGALSLIAEIPAKEGGQRFEIHSGIHFDR